MERQGASLPAFLFGKWWGAAVAGKGEPLNLGAGLITLIVAVTVAAALWLSVNAAYENTTLAVGTDQILDIVLDTRALVAQGRNVNFSTGEDLLPRLMATGHYRPNINQKVLILNNPWHRPITAQWEPPANVKIELGLPNYACRHLLTFFNKDIRELGLTKVEARDDSEQSWRLLYLANQQQTNNNMSLAAIEVGCGQVENVVVSLTFSLR